MVQPWERILDKGFVSGILTRAGLYLLAYELLKDSLISRLKSFFWTGIEDGKETFSPKYAQVLSKHKNMLVASCMWLEENGVLTAQDVQSVMKIREFRNDIAHELPALLAEGKRELQTEHVVQIYRLLSKVDRWWIINVELATNEDFAGQEVAEHEVKSGTMIFMDHLLSMLFPEETAPLNSD
ncbi:MAG TPA: hypothetical protein DCQ33_11835 [Nitrospira sp.]|nr:hypothetical protein [Nitrospira sp.]